MPNDELLHVMQASLQFSDPRRVIERDLETIYGRGADVIGHTEASNLRPLLLDVCKQFGYRLVQPVNPISGKPIATPIAVKRSTVVVSSAYMHIVPGQSGLAREGGHEPRGVTTVELDWRSETIFVSECHMLTGWGRDDERDKQIAQQWFATTKLVSQLARGFDVSVLMGDVNYDPDDKSSDEPSQWLNALGFESVFDEVGRPDQPTHGRRTIDQLYTLRRDRRLSVKRVKVWDDDLGVDHKQVSAWLSISKRAAA